jgi:hypothetical protein
MFHAITSESGGVAACEAAQQPAASAMAAVSVFIVMLLS